MSAVDVYLADLRAEIPGPSWTRRGLLREAGDHLEDATLAYQDAGYSPAEAETLALRDFGPVREVAPGFRETVALDGARRTALLLILVMLPQTVLWDGGIDLGASVHDPAPYGGLYHVLDIVIPYAGMAGVIGALLALVATTIGRRWIEVGRATARLAAWWILATTILVLTIGFTMLVITHAMTISFAAIWLAFMVLPFATVALSAQRTLAAC